jgi:hypothetical protein
MNFCKTTRSSNLITNKEKVAKFKKEKRKMERLEGRDYLLSTYHHAATTIL